MKIPCDTIARLSHLLEPNDDPAIASFRLDNGMVIATNRRFMAIEHVGQWDGVFYVRNDEAMIEQCRTEAQFATAITFTAVPALKWTTAITTMGWSMSENIGVWPESTDYDLWRERILEPCKTPLTQTMGAISVHVDALRQLAAASPSGMIVMERHSDPRDRPTVVRDVNADNWVGFFRAQLDDGYSHNDAVVPGWCR